jgi:hypothetical protein
MPEYEERMEKLNEAVKEEISIDSKSFRKQRQLKYLW